MEPAIRAHQPHVIPREPPTIVRPRRAPERRFAPVPPPPPRSARRATTSPEPWPTALLTLPAPVYQPLVDPAPAAADRRPRRRLALGALSAALAAAGLALALWQLYFFLESTGSGRALLDRLAGLVAAVAGRF